MKTSIRRIAVIELPKGRSRKETIKAVRNKIHQVGSAYQPQSIDYTHLIQEMESLPREIQDPMVKQYCMEVMKMHTSTRERLNILDQFYKTSLIRFHGHQLFARRCLRIEPASAGLDAACQ